MPSYQHTQTGPIAPALFVVAIGFVIAAGLSGDPGLRVAFGAIAAAAALVAATIATLTVEDLGDHLKVRFGPLPLIARRIAYSDISAVAVGRTSLFDGHGIHWFPGRGWTFNLWSRDCVELTVNGRRLRIGSPDAANLARFLQSRIGSAQR